MVPTYEFLLLQNTHLYQNKCPPNTEAKDTQPLARPFVLHLRRKVTGVLNLIFG